MYRRDVYAPDKRRRSDKVYPDRSNRIIVNSEDSFKFCYRFKDMEEVPNVLSLGNLNLCIRYFIKGRENSYYVKKNGTDLLNCILIDDQKLLKAVIEDHKLGEGDLFAEFNIYFKDFEFAPAIAVTKYVKDTGVTLINPTKMEGLKLDNGLPTYNEATGETKTDRYGFN